MTLENTESRPIVKIRKVNADYKRPFAECEVKGCGKKFYGPRRNAKLGGHNYQIHLRPGLKKLAVKATKKAKKAVMSVPLAIAVDHRGSVLAELALKREQLDIAIQALESLDA